MSVNVNVEYCGTCGYKDKFDELKETILRDNPDVQVIGYEGRRASFEVKVNNTMVHSKLCTMAFPDFDDVTDIVTGVSKGGGIRQVAKQQPITNCTIF